MGGWNWNGGRWWKFDFHNHTPASDDYGNGSDLAKHKNRTPREWLLDYMRAGVDCVAITDHNIGTWIDQLRGALAELDSEQPDGFRPIYLFPGVEISVNGGLHLLAIFYHEKTTSDIDSLLGATGFTGTKGTSDAVTTLPFAEVVRAVEQAGGIAIPAHVDSDDGLFKLQGTTLAQALDCGGVFAMEVVDPDAEKPRPYRDRRLQWTEVLGSDSHHPTGNPGQRSPAAILLGSRWDLRASMGCGLRCWTALCPSADRTRRLRIQTAMRLCSLRRSRCGMPATWAERDPFG